MAWDVELFDRLLRAGINVYTGLGGYFLPGQPEYERLQAAGEAGHASLAAGGNIPGLISDVFPLFLSRLHRTHPHHPRVAAQPRLQLPVGGADPDRPRHRRRARRHRDQQIIRQRLGVGARPVGQHGRDRTGNRLHRRGSGRQEDRAGTRRRRPRRFGLPRQEGHGRRGAMDRGGYSRRSAVPHHHQRADRRARPRTGLARRTTSSRRGRWRSTANHRSWRRSAGRTASSPGRRTRC